MPASAAARITSWIAPAAALPASAQVAITGIASLRALLQKDE